MRHRGLDIRHHLGVIELHAQLAALANIVLGVAEFHAALGAVEQRRGADRVARGGEAVGHVADVVIDAENLLDDDDALGRGCGAGGIGGQSEAVRGLEFDGLTHEAFSRCGALIA